jgi:hypothetical protein
LEYLQKTFVYQYLGYSRKRKSLFSTIKLLFSLQPESETFDEITPFYLLNFLSCSELNLKRHLLQPNADSSVQFIQQFEKREYQTENHLKIINLDDFEEILLDFDRYVKDAKKRSISPVHVFMKNFHLSSLMHSKPAEETVFRYMDIRLRVYLYSAMRKSTSAFRQTDKFYSLLNKARLGADVAKTLASASASMQASTSKTQRCLVLAVHDVLLKHAWIDDGLVGDVQVDMLRKWLRIVEGQRDVPVLPKVYNTALFNRLLNLPIVFSEYLQTNNPVLNGLGGLATKNSTGLADRVLSQAAEFDPLLKSLLAKKTAINMEKWENEFSKPGLEAVELNQANNRILFSLKLTIKHCQVIQIVQNYFELKDSLVESSNVEPNSQEVHLLAPLNPDTATTNKETSNSNSYLRYLMSKLLLAHVLKSSKNREMQDVLARFRDTVKKDQDTIFKNYEYDHLVAQNVNFCNMAIMLSNQKKPISKKIEAPELVIDQATVNQYLSQAADSSFLFPNKSLLETNLAGVFVELVKSVLEAQVSVYQRASLEIAVRRQKRKQILEPKRKDNLAGNLMGNNESQLLPFLVNFLSSFVGKSYSIVTNNEEECYIIGREEFLDLMVVLLRESGAYTQHITAACREHYLSTYIHAVYARVVSHASLRFLKRHFLLLLRDFHKLVEGQLAEKNFGVVYELDRLSKFARYAVYDGGLVLDKLQEAASDAYEDRLNAVTLESQDIKARAAAFEGSHLPLKVLEFGAQLHNANMAALEEKAAKVLEDRVTLVDVKTGLMMRPADIRGRLGSPGSLDDAQIGKVHAAVERLKQVFREKVVLELNKLEGETKRLEEQVNKEDNTRKKIREMTVRESMLKEELAATKAEMDALNQQNAVLERDIHTCNFERINLTRQLQDAKEKLDKIQIDVNRQIAERAHRPRKSLFPSIGKDGQVTQSVNLKPGQKQLSKVRSQQGLTDLRHEALEEFPEESEINPSKEELPGRDTVGYSSSSKPKKKGFAFVNGRLERRFNVKK